MPEKIIIGVVGAGAMGSGIAQVAATAGHEVILYDSNSAALQKAKQNIDAGLKKLSEKNKISFAEASQISGRIGLAKKPEDFSQAGLVIEAVVENSEVKQSLFSALDKIVSANCILASNTSSLSITSIAAALADPSRFIGIHFFNPATIMPLVEIIPGIASRGEIVKQSKDIISAMGKVIVVCKDTPGFIVNRIARPFYGEAMRIYEEQIADIATIDWALKEKGGFKMGPFELTDLIGHDVNYTVTETVWKQFYFDPRFKPAICQKRLVEAKMFGRKAGQGFYNYAEGALVPAPEKDEKLADEIFLRVISMLVNEAAEALYLGIGSREDLDLAMTKGVNYPKGLLKWADEIGPAKILETLNGLHELYADDRYRPSVLLKSLVKQGKGFYA
jgi:3-hydroxybutyryl-CoA dehydrogenase